MSDNISIIKAIDGVRYIMVDYMGANLVKFSDTVKSSNTDDNPYESGVADGFMESAAFLLHVINDFDKQELDAIAKVSNM